ncbi:MAG: four helix bundle protein [Ignavibacteria bacterium]|nr:four helix bundle protein [Ignavibacteria bacterium]MBI3765003.1 four helix bundle protein [Ignavibacteriales bacterium]
MKEENQAKKFDLEDRLVNFAVRIARIVESLPNTRTGNHIAGQLIRSGTSPALNYGEAQSAESRSDFIHKIKIVLKELRESNISLKIIKRLTLIKPTERIDPVMDEANQLIAIFVKSISTAQRNKIKKSQ